VTACLTWAIQGMLGHRSITSTAVYTALAPNRFKDFTRSSYQGAVGTGDGRGTGLGAKAEVEAGRVTGLGAGAEAGRGEGGKVSEFL